MEYTKDYIYKNILYHYLGCKIAVFEYKNRECYTAKLDFINIYGFISGSVDKEFLKPGEDDYFEFDFERDKDSSELKLILIRPENMSDSQKAEYFRLTKRIFKDRNQFVRFNTPESLLFLFQNGIDAFDLIDNGIAIEKFDKNYFRK